METFTYKWVHLILQSPHYRCVKCFIPTTRAEVDADTVSFFPKSINFPEVNIQDFLKQAALDIVALLKNPPNPMIPSLQAGLDTTNAIYILASLLQNTNNTQELVRQAHTKTFQHPHPQIAPPTRVPLIAPKFLSSAPSMSHCKPNFFPRLHHHNQA